MHGNGFRGEQCRNSSSNGICDAAIFADQSCLDWVGCSGNKTSQIFGFKKREALPGGGATQK